MTESGRVDFPVLELVYNEGWNINLPRWIRTDRLGAILMLKYIWYDHVLSGRVVDSQDSTWLVSFRFISSHFMERIWFFRFSFHLLMLYWSLFIYFQMANILHRVHFIMRVTYPCLLSWFFPWHLDLSISRNAQSHFFNNPDFKKHF